jgi:hypothetical protein
MDSLFSYERVTDGIAVAALFSPGWLPYFEEASREAGLFLPILGAVWLIVQIWDKVFRRNKK